MSLFHKFLAGFIGFTLLTFTLGCVTLLNHKIAVADFSGNKIVHAQNHGATSHHKTLFSASSPATDCPTCFSFQDFFRLSDIGQLIGSFWQIFALFAFQVVLAVLVLLSIPRLRPAWILDAPHLMHRLRAHRTVVIRS